MQMLYNSENFAVVRFDLTQGAVLETVDAQAHAPVLSAPPAHGGYEIVDKFARKEIFIQGAAAQSFHTEVQALIETSPSQETFDEFLGRYSPMMQHPLVLH